MSSQDYLNQASAMLRRAALARKQEADELRHQLDEKERERHDILNKKERERIIHLERAARSDSDAERGEMFSRAQLLANEKSKIDKEYNLQKRKLDEELNNIQRSVDNINNMASSLGG